jgi:hypothetical protein
LIDSLREIPSSVFFFFFETGEEKPENAKTQKAKSKKKQKSKKQEHSEVLFIKAKSFFKWSFKKKQSREEGDEEERNTLESKFGHVISSEY